MQLRRPPVYDQIADALRADILSGGYEPTEANPTANELPGAAELGMRYGVSDKTAARAIQQLIAEGLVRARPGLRPLAVPSSERTSRWPMHRRYARAREAGGLVFGNDMQGREVVKKVTGAGWTSAPDHVALLLRLAPDARVWARSRMALVDGEPAEVSTSYFPADIADGTELMSPGPFPAGGVVAVLEGIGHRIIRTYNEVRSRLATPDELAIFGPEPELAPLQNRIMIAVTHAVYGASDEPLEAVISARPAHTAVVAFQTYEGPRDDHPQDPSITEKTP